MLGGITPHDLERGRDCAVHNRCCGCQQQPRQARRDQVDKIVKACRRPLSEGEIASFAYVAPISGGAPEPFVPSEEDIADYYAAARASDQADRDIPTCNPAVCGPTYQITANGTMAEVHIIHDKYRGIRCTDDHGN